MTTVLERLATGGSGWSRTGLGWPLGAGAFDTKKMHEAMKQHERGGNVSAGAIGKMCLGVA